MPQGWMSLNVRRPSFTAREKTGVMNKNRNCVGQEYASTGGSIAALKEVLGELDRVPFESADFNKSSADDMVVIVKKQKRLSENQAAEKDDIRLAR